MKENIIPKKITEEKFKERAMLFLSKEEASNFTRSVFHPTKEDIEDDKKHCHYLLGKGVNFENLQSELSSDPLFERVSL